MEELKVNKNGWGEKMEWDSNVAVQIKKPGIVFGNIGLDKDHRTSAAASSKSHKCTKCFYSHFPSPNTSLCKWNKKNDQLKLKIILSVLKYGQIQAEEICSFEQKIPEQLLI